MNVIKLVLGALTLTACALLGVPAPAGSAQPCPDVELVFARGSGEPPGVGGVGQAYVDALTAQAGGRSVAVYPVNYAASTDFGGGIDFARTFVDGLRDAGGHMQSTAANCPNTRIVLGGYSQGAALAGFVTSAAIPKEVPESYVSYLPQPLPPSMANHVAAVILFGRPSNQFLTENGAPPITIGPQYAGKTLDLCAAGDTICNGASAAPPTIAHVAYLTNGMEGQAADYAVSRL